MTIDTSAVIQVIVFAVSLIAATVWLRSTLQKQRHQELEDLVSTRGQVIDDLRRQLEELRAELGELRGQVKTLQNMQTTEIVIGVVDGVIDSFLTNDDLCDRLRS